MRGYQATRKRRAMLALSAAAAAAPLVPFPAAARAALATFDGDAAVGTAGDNATWASAFNWTTGGAIDTAPSNTAPGDDLTFGGGTAGGVIDLGANRFANSLAFTKNYTLGLTNTTTFTLTTGTSAVSVAPGMTGTVNAILAGTAGLSLTGGGTLVLNRATGNTFTGNIAVDGAGTTLAYVGTGTSADPTALGAGAKTITLTNGGAVSVLTALSNPTATSKSFVIGTGGGTIDTATGATLQLDDPSQFSGAGALTKTGVGLLYLNSQAYAYTGSAVTVSGGTLRVAGNAGVLGAGDLAIAVSGGATFDALIGLSGNKPITITGTGVGAAGALIASSGTVGAFTSAVTLAGNASVGGAGSLNLASAVGDGGGGYVLTKVGTGTTTLAATGTYAGGTTVSAGTLAANAVGALGTGNVTVAGGTLTQSVANALNGASQSLTVSSGTATLGFANAYGGTTTVSGGTLNATAAGAVPAGNVTVSAGTLNVNAAGAVVGNVAVSGGTLAESAAGVLNGAAQTLSVSGGTARLTVGNTYGGGTTVSGGVLVLGNGTTGSATGTGGIALNGGSLTSTTAGGTASGTVAVAAAGTLAPGGVFATTAAFNSTVGTLNLGGLSLNGSALAFDLSTQAGTNDLINVIGPDAFFAAGTSAITLGQLPSQPGTYRLIQFTSTNAANNPTAGNFAAPAANGGGRLTYAVSIDPGAGANQYYVDLVASGTGAAVNTVFNNPAPNPSAAGADWNDSTNWSNGVPSLAGDVATINNGTATATTINLNGGQRVGSLSFANAGTGAYTLAAGTGGTLYLDTGTASGATLASSTNSNTVSAPVALTSATTVANTAAGTTLTISGLVTGAAMTVGSAGSPNVGTINLNSATSNTFSGLTINGGTVIVTAGTGGGRTNAGTGPVTINAGGTLSANGADALGYTGGTTSPATFFINGGTLTQGTGAYRETLQALNFTGGTLLANVGNTGDVSGNFSIGGPGTVTSNAAATPALISGGKVSLQATTTTFTVASGAAAGTAVNGVTPGADFVVSSALINYTGTTNALVKSGFGVLSLTGANTFGGNVSVVQGPLRINSSAGLGVPATTKTVSVIPTSNPTSLPSLQLDGSAGNIALPSTIAFSTSYDALNAGVPIPGYGAIVNLAGNNTIAGTITLTAGGGGTTLLALANSSLTASGAIAILSGQTNRGVILRGDGNTALTGVVSNSTGTGTGIMSMTRDAGTGTSTLSGANTYSGGTTVTSGTLLANYPTSSTTVSSTGTGAVTVSGAGTLGGSGRILGTVAVNLGGTLAPGANGLGTLSIANTLTSGTSGTGTVPTYLVELRSATTPVAGTDNDLIALTGATTAGVLNLNAADRLNLIPLTDVAGPTTYTIATFASLTGTFNSVLINGASTQTTDPSQPNYALVNYGSGTSITVTVGTLSAVPEPAAAGLAAAAGLGLLARRRRRRA